MAQLTVVYWRDIPAQVTVKAGRRNAKRKLSERFEKAIDRAAMRAKLRDSDSYLAEWRRSAPVACAPPASVEIMTSATAVRHRGSVSKVLSKTTSSLLPRRRER